MSVLEKMGIVTADMQVEMAEALSPRWEKAINVAESQIPHIFALATAYWLAARIAHRTQLAASILSPAPPETVRSRRLRRFLGVFLVAGIFYLEYCIFADPSKVDWLTSESFLNGLFAFVIFHQAAWLLSSSKIPLFTSSLHWKMVRSPAGLAMGRIDRTKGCRAGRFLNLFAIALAAGGYTYVAFREDAVEVIKIVAPVACLTAIGAKPLGKRMSVRWAIIGLIIFEAFVLASSVLGAFIALSYVAKNQQQPHGGKLGKSTPSSSPSADDNASSDDPFALSNLTAFTSVFPAVYAAGNAFLIVICYRFDYHLFRLRQGDAFVPLALEATVSPSDGRIVSVAVPRSAPTWFRKPYFMTSLLLTLASHLSAPVLLHLLASTLSPDDAKEVLSSPTKELTTSWMGLFIAGPVAGLGVVLLALSRGQGKEMWKYEEVWVSRDPKEDDEAGSNNNKAQGAIRLEEGTEDIPQEPAPAYVEKDVRLAAALSEE